MTEAGTLCNNADVLKKAGLNANLSGASEIYTNVYIKEAEGFICASARYDFVTNYSGCSVIGREFLRDVASSLSALKVINYDMGGYTSRTESQTMLDINYSAVVEGINLLRDDKYRDFIINGVVN